MLKFNENAHFFIAVPIPQYIQSYLSNLSENLKQDFTYKTWTYEGDFHITLSFLGSATKEQIQQINYELSDLTIAAFNLQLNHLGTFGKKSGPRVLWAGIFSQPLLNECQNQVSICTAKAGFPVEDRPYNPHITLGKKWVGRSLDNLGEVLHQYELDQDMQWWVDDICLYQINLNKKPKYEVIGRYTLQN